MFNVEVLKADRHLFKLATALNEVCIISIDIITINVVVGGGVVSVVVVGGAVVVDVVTVVVAVFVVVMDVVVVVVISTNLHMQDSIGRVQV